MSQFKENVISMRSTREELLLMKDKELRYRGDALYHLAKRAHESHEPEARRCAEEELCYVQQQQHDRDIWYRGRERSPKALIARWMKGVPKWKLI
jgi:hypothetical protein